MNTSSDDRPAPVTSYIMAPLILIFIILSCTGNALLLISLIMRKVKGHAYIFIISLSACDLFFTIVCFIQPTLNYLARRNVVGDGLCSAQAYFFTMALGTCMWHVAFTCLNHFVLVSNQEFFSKHQSHCATAMQLFFCYGLPVLLLVPGLRGTDVSYSEKRLRCIFEQESNVNVIVLDTVLLVVSYLSMP